MANMQSEFNFQRYLTAKRSVDDRALNQNVWKALEGRVAALEGSPSLRVLELGGGIGTMFQRLVEWGLLSRADYTLVDEAEANIAFLRREIPIWARRQGLEIFEQRGELYLAGEGTDLHLEPVASDMDAFLRMAATSRWDLIVANAFLDLVDCRTALPMMKNALMPGGLMYLTINFDGLTSFEPVGDEMREGRILKAYHQSMDMRETARGKTGGSLTGRRLFTWLRQAGLRILAAGGSDWTVFPRGGQYPGDEAYFLRCILGFFQESLQESPDLAQGELNGWLKERRDQIDRGELVFLAHQYDFLVEAE